MTNWSVLIQSTAAVHSLKEITNVCCEHIIGNKWQNKYKHGLKIVPSRPSDSGHAFVKCFSDVHSATNWLNTWALSCLNPPFRGHENSLRVRDWLLSSWLDFWEGQKSVCVGSKPKSNYHKFYNPTSLLWVFQRKLTTSSGGRGTEAKTKSCIVIGCHFLSSLFIFFEWWVQCTFWQHDDGCSVPG